MFEVLTAYGREAARWQHYFDLLPYAVRDVHYSPAYARVQDSAADLSEGVRCAVYHWEEFDHFVMQPFMLRNYPTDMTCLYGYGGPVSNMVTSFSNGGSRLWLWFEKAFEEWRKEHGVICEFCSLHPLLFEHQSWLLRESKITLHLVKNVVIADLKQADLFKSFSRNRRRSIEAQAAGVTVEIAEFDDMDVRTFSCLYDQSMNDKNAAERWRFSQRTWAKYRDEMHLRNAMLYRAWSRDVDESMLLVIYGYGRAYAHFMAGDKHHDLLYYTAMQDMQKIGSSVFHLGGGLTSSPDDKLLAAKMSYSKNVAPVYVYKRVFDPEAYLEACTKAAILVPAIEDYFPAYRAKEAA